MAYDTSVIGVESDCGTMIVEQGKVHEFAKAVGIDDPLCHDPEAAKAAGFAGVVAPPTFLAAAAFWGKGPGAAFKLGMDIRRILHGEQSYEIYRPLVAGDVLHGTRVITDITEKAGKRGGTMTLVTEETTWCDDDGEAVVTSRSVLIETGQKVED